jgi:penicillin-binding protein 2
MVYQPSLIRTLLLMAVSLLLLVGCDPASGAESTAEPVAQVTHLSPEEVLRGFLDAWNKQDLRAMYSYVSPASREIYPYEVFERRYTAAHQAMTFEGVTYQLKDTKIQGVTSAVTYSATLQSPLFGEIQDPNRTMRLIQSGDGWQIAWSPMDILDGLASEVSIDVLSRFPPRANIYDRQGNFVVQQDGTIIAISLIKQDTRNVDECLTLLAKVMQRSSADLNRLFTNYNADTLFYVGEIDNTTYLRWREDMEEICGLYNDNASGFNKITTYQGRDYAGHRAAAHITGYIGRQPGDQASYWQSKGYQPGDIVGVTGIEFAYEPELAGKPERYLKMFEPGGATIRELGGTVAANPIPIQLTIDMELQRTVSQAISDAFNYAQINWAIHATGAAAVVMDIHTGEILALASYPNYDPSVFNPESSYSDPQGIITDLVNSPYKPLANKAVQEQYTPGSVYKIFTLAAAANEDIFQPGQIFMCDLRWYGSERFGDAVEFREDWRVSDKMEAAGEITMTQALTTSCNPFFWEMGALMFRRDANLQTEYASLFGFGSRTGFNVLGPEAAGNLPPPREPTEAINNAIGQGDVQVTALQLVTAVSAVANRGTLYAPYIVKQVGGFDGTDVSRTFEPRIVRELNLPDEVYDIIWEGMCNVPIDRDLGTAWRVFGGSQTPPPYTSCGKTGTAEAGTRDSGIPPNAWYVSFAPADNPQIATVVVVPNSREGSEVAAPITRRILDFYFGAPEAAFPDWWSGEYIPITPPQGVAG